MTSSTGSVFGPYTAILAVAIAIATVGAALALHVAMAFGFTAASADSQFLDASAGAVILLLFGTSAGIRIGGNGALSAARAAHARLDAIGAPAASSSPDTAASSAPASSGG